MNLNERYTVNKVNPLPPMNDERESLLTISIQYQA